MPLLAKGLLRIYVPFVGHAEVNSRRIVFCGGPLDLPTQSRSQLRAENRRTDGAFTE
jgi:hypothetical protein